MIDVLPPIEAFTFPPPLSQPTSPHQTISPSTENVPNQSLPSDFHFDYTGLAHSPEHPAFNASWGSVDTGLNNVSSQMPFDGQGQISPAGQGGTLNAGLSTLTSSIPGDNAFSQGHDLDSHLLSHTSSSSSLASLASSHSNGLLVQTFPTDNTFHVPSQQHSRHSSYSSVSTFDDNKGLRNPMPVMDMNMYSMPMSQGIPPNQLFTTSAIRQQPPRLALQTDGLGKMISRDRSASRTTPYHRERSESVSLKSEGGDDIGALLSASTSQSACQTPWSITPARSIASGLNQMSLHHRRTSSNTSYAVNSPVRPMLSRARRSSSFILSKKASQDLGDCDLKLQGSAAEREETVRLDLTEKADELKAMTSNSQQDKARALWVRRWLQLSYTAAVGSTVPRQGLYHSYTLSCQAYGLKPINSASFGKAVRNAYPGIKTRRLGQRGNSKYHYVSIRPAIRTEAERLNEYGDSSGAWHVAPEDGSMGFQPASNVEVDMEGEDLEDDDEDDEDTSFGTLRKSPSTFDFRASQQRAALSRDRSTSNQELTSQRQQFVRRHTTAAEGTYSHTMGTAQNPVFTISGFPSLGQVTAELTRELPMDTIQAFWNSFCQHQEILAGCVRGLHFDRFELNCRTFWSSLPHSSVQACTNPTMSSFISAGMAITYDHFFGALLEKLLSPLPLASQNALRNLADNLETIMEQAFQGFPQAFSEAKVELAVRAAHLFSRFIDLHQLTAALSPILSNQSQLRTMLAAWDNLDVRGVADQCALSCSCQQDVLESVLADFQQWLVEVEASSSRHGRAVEKLGQWVDKTMQEVQNGVPGVTMRIIACRVGFITSQVMRDFTLKSDQTFGLFQLVKTWIDDWVSMAALRQTALTTHSVESAHSSHSSASSMNVFIPPPGEVSRDLTTAVPFSQRAMHSLQPNLGGWQAQYLSAPTFISDSITPRPSFGDGTSGMGPTHFV